MLFRSTQGQQPVGARYLVEVVQDMNGDARSQPDGRPEATSKYGTILRAANSQVYPMQTFFTGGDAFMGVQDGTSANTPWKQVFPLKDVGDGFYRCVTVTDQGDVYSLLLVLDRSKPNWPVFMPKEKFKIGHTAMGCVYVVEHQAGQVEVLIFDLPGVTSMKGVYTPGSQKAATWNATSQTQVPLNGLNVHDPNRSYWIDGAWNAAQNRVEIFLMVRDPADTTGAMTVWEIGRASCRERV